MHQYRIPAVFMRGGTSNAIIFHRKDLPVDEAEWEQIFLRVMGSPDPYGRQLDGMGGGVSSLSKICIVGPPTHPDADVDFTFVQVRIKEAVVSQNGNCGNMSSAIGPFAVEEGMVKVEGSEAVVRIHNTNTSKIIESHFSIYDGMPIYDGDFRIPGVSSTGSAIRLDFLDPGGAGTGRLLPADGEFISVLNIDGLGRIEVSMIDAANPGVFIDPTILGLSGTELPLELEANDRVLALLEKIRVAAALRMGMARSEAEASDSAIPFVAMISPPANAPTLSGSPVNETEVDLTARIMSQGQLHRALPVTACLCTAVAAAIPGSIVARQLKRTLDDRPLKFGMPSGILDARAEVLQDNDEWTVRSASIYRTARRLFEGNVLYLPPAAKASTAADVVAA